MHYSLLDHCGAYKDESEDWHEHINIYTKNNPKCKLRTQIQSSWITLNRHWITALNSAWLCFPSCLHMAQHDERNFIPANLHDPTTETHDRSSALKEVEDKLRKGKMIAIAGVGFFADAYDLFIINVVMLILGNMFKVTHTDKSLVSTAALIGTMIGQMVCTITDTHLRVQFCMHITN